MLKKKQTPGPPFVTFVALRRAEASGKDPGQAACSSVPRASPLDWERGQASDARGAGKAPDGPASSGGLFRLGSGLLAPGLGAVHLRPGSPACTGGFSAGRARCLNPGPQRPGFGKKK